MTCPYPGLLTFCNEEWYYYFSWAIIKIILRLSTRESMSDMEAISPARLHELWKTIDSTPPNILGQLNDRDLVNWLTEQFDQNHPLPAKELSTLKKYLASRLQLIRDLTLG